MKILTPLLNETRPAIKQLTIALQVQITMMLCLSPLTGLAQEGSALSLQAASPATMEPSSPLSSFTSWIFGLSCLLVVAVFVATLWPRKNDSNLLQRQRKFARVDGLFLALMGRPLTELEVGHLLEMGAEKGLQWATEQVQKTETLSKLTLLSLSMGGASLASRNHVEKGHLLILKLSSLPDFPNSEQAAIVRVVWSHPNGDTGESFDICGAKFLYWDNTPAPDTLAQYLNFLMDEPNS